MDIKKMLFGSFEVKDKIVDFFPLLNITDKQIELKNNETIKLFHKKDFFSTDQYSDNELDLIYNYFNNYFNVSKEDQGFSTYIRLSKKNKLFENSLNEETGFPPFDKYKRNKLRNIKDRNKKFIEVFFGTSSYYFNSAFVTLMDKLGYEQMEDTEIFSFLYDHFNPDKSTNDLKLKNLSLNTKQKLQSDEHQLLEILYDSYIDTNSEELIIGETYGEIFNIITPSINGFNINGLIKDLSNLDSEIIISIKAKKSSDKNLLSMKARFAGSNLLSMIGTNSNISYNINQLLEHLKITHTSLCSVNITLILLNKDKEKLKKDKIVFEEWAGAEYIYNRFNRSYEYLYAIPGLNINGNHSMYLPSDYLATLCLPTQYYKQYTTSIFYDKNNLIQPFDYKLKTRKINSGGIIAPTRSGKSVLLNYIFFNKLIKNYNREKNCFDLSGLLIDFGQSYKNLINAINDFLDDNHKISYKSINLNNSYNILDLSFGYEITMDDINNKVNLLLQFFDLALNNLTEEEKVLLDNTIKKTYELMILSKENLGFKNKFIENNETFYYWDKYVESNYTDINMFINAMPTITSLSGIMAQDKELTSMFSLEIQQSLNNKLSLFVSSKEGRLFSSKSKEILLSDILIVDFEELTNNVGGKLPSLLLQMLINYKYQEFISPRLEGIEKFIFIDEYPQFLKIDPKIEKTVDFLLKTGQKKNLDTFIIAQTISSFHEDFFPNLGTLTLFNLNLPSEIKHLSDKITVPEEYFEPIKKLQFSKNKFSDLMVLEISNEKLLKSTLRFELSRTDLEFFTTAKDYEIEVKD